jgi:hypothetical protein
MFMPNGPMPPMPNGNGPPPPPGAIPNGPGGPPLPPHMAKPNGSGPRFPHMPIITNPNAPNAPAIHPCGACLYEAQADFEDVIKCESGCNFWYHCRCVGLSPDAYKFLRQEIYVEWMCENCARYPKFAPLHKFKPY